MSKRLKVAIDIDGTITEHPEFFAFLTASLEKTHEVHIISGRSPTELERTAAELAVHGVRYDKINLIGVVWHGKGEYCEKEEIDILFEDMDEFIEHIPERTLVFKIRNGGNFNFHSRDWR